MSKIKANLNSPYFRGFAVFCIILGIATPLLQWNYGADNTNFTDRMIAFEIFILTLPLLTCLIGEWKQRGQKEL